MLTDTRSLKKIFFVYFFLAMPGLRCFEGFSLVAESGDCSLLTAVASLVAEYRLQSAQASVVAAHGLSSCGSWALEHRLDKLLVHWLSCFEACGILPDQGSNPCLWHWQIVSLPLNHQGSSDTKSYLNLFWQASIITRPVGKRPADFLPPVADFPTFFILVLLSL